MKEACCERNPRESTTTAEICKRAAVWRELVNQRHGNKSVEKVA
jgi:hypothetical protein